MATAAIAAGEWYMYTQRVTNNNAVKYE